MLSGIPTLQFLLERGWRNLLQMLEERVGLGHLLLNFLNVVPVVGECGVDIGQRELREAGDDLVRAATLQLMPNIDVLNANSYARNASFSPANARLFLDMSRHDRLRL